MSKYNDITIQEICSLLKKNQEDRVRSENISRSRDERYNPYPNGWNRLDFYKECFSDMFIDGFLMTYPHGTVIRQAQRSYYYRGEQQIFKSSQASLFRRLNEITNKEKSLVEEFVAYMRIADFLDLLLKFDHTQEFLALPLKSNNKSLNTGIDLLYEQLAQHYGFETVWLDVTSDFEVALFFSCCKFNNTLKKWEPLNNMDFNVKHETKFGVIFRKPTNHTSNFIPLDLQQTKILPVGFQPFMRCHMQNSYVALMDKSYNLQKDNSFEMLRFKHSEKLSNYIFKKMDCGKKIYPYEGLNLMTEELEELKKRKIFIIETFDYVCEEKKFKSLNKEKLKQLLVHYGYEIINASNYFSNEKKKKVNELYDDFNIEKTYNIKLKTRLTFIPPEN
ncbi:MAG: FRG domain-containing protein [Bacteroidales bacterium]|nr:FRG domain-containing protein [Bacteroidales bacterium]